jgi:putative inorganic carbon (hco3(-)) transporter
MRLGFLLPAILIIFLAASGEGGRAPATLMAVHALALLAMLASIMGSLGPGIPPPPGGAARRVALASGAVLLLSALSAVGARYPLAGAFGLWDLAVALGLFAAAASPRAGAGELSVLSVAVVASSTLQALTALVRRPGGVLSSGASFLNPNHLAAFLNLGCVLGADRALDALSEGRRRAGLAWGGVAAVHLVAVMLLMSRGAVFALLISCALLLAAHVGAFPARIRLLATYGFALAAVLGGALLMLRFRQSFDPYRFDRLSIWAASAKMLLARPWLGHGPGMFRFVAPAYNFPSTVGPLCYEKVFSGAHDAFLTFAVENGAPAALTLLLACSYALLRLGRSGPPLRRSPERGVALALLALGLQGLFEDLQERPALVLVPALLLGSSLRRSDGRRWAPAAAPPEIEPIPRSRSGLDPVGARRTLKGAVLLLGFYLFLVPILLPYLADREARAAIREGRGGIDRMRRAAVLNPLHPDYRMDLAMASLNSGPPSPERYAAAAIDLLEARRLNPINSWYPLLLARLEAEAAGKIFADATAVERAIAGYRTSAALAPTDPRPLFELGGYLSSLGRFEEALAAAMGALAIEPNFLRARMLETSILIRLKRVEAARESLGRLEASRKALAGYLPQSGYARELIADDSARRLELQSGFSALISGQAPGPGH